jgi:Cytochrome P460
MRAVHALGLGISAIVAVIAFDGHGWIQTAALSDEARSEGAVDGQGNLRVPANYRSTYRFLGSWAVAADEGQASKELHVVYASPETVDAYRKDGRFIDGAVLIKEVFKTATREMTTGNVSRAETLKGWFVMVKDSTGRHQGSKLWGDGWGWSWFDAADPAKTTSTDFKTDCQSCHIPAQTTDWVYVDGYPSLRH